MDKKRTSMTFTLKANMLTYILAISLITVAFQPSDVNASTKAIKGYEEQQKQAISALQEYLNNSANGIKNGVQASAKDIKILNITDKQWSDASLGCPQPGFSYPQVIVPGYYAKLEYANASYDIHMAKSRAFVCTKSKKLSKKTPKVKLKTLQIQTISEAVKKDLAQKTATPLEEIKIVSIKPTDWPDKGLGCSDIISLNNTQGVKGYAITLDNNGRRYQYHTDRKDAFLPCPAILEQ